MQSPDISSSRQQQFAPNDDMVERELLVNVPLRSPIFLL